MSRRDIAGVLATVTLVLLLIGFDAFVLPGGGHLAVTLLWVLGSMLLLWQSFRPGEGSVERRTLRGIALVFSGTACVWTLRYVPEASLGLFFLITLSALFGITGAVLLVRGSRA